MKRFLLIAVLGLLSMQAQAQVPLINSASQIKDGIITPRKLSFTIPFVSSTSALYISSSIHAIDIYASGHFYGDGSQLTGISGGSSTPTVLGYPFHTINSSFTVGHIDGFGRHDIWYTAPSAFLRLGASASDGDPFNSDSEGLVVFKPSVDRQLTLQSEDFRLTTSDWSKIFFDMSPDGLIVNGYDTTLPLLYTVSASSKTVINHALQYTDGNQAAGKVLTSDASGNATWQTGVAGSEVDPLSLHTTGGVMTGAIKMGVTQAQLGGTALASSEQPGGGGLDPGTVDLGAASNFAILTGAGITNNTPPSAITGDMGVSPIAESAITGFVLTDFGSYSTSPQVAGFVYAADMSSPTPSNLTLAKGALTAAYGDAAGRAPADTDIGGGDLCGLTISSGVHKFSSAAAATCSFILTGNAQSVFIFQVGTALTVSNSASISLSGGVLPKNIFWQVGTSATIGSGVAWTGTILADQSITVNTGSTVQGRLFASIGSVTLLANTVVIPSSSTFLGGHPAALAFDGNTSTYWASVGTAPQWLLYDFGPGNDQVVSRYSLRNVANGGSHDPTAWELQGSTDTITWHTLDSQSVGAWAQPETKTINVPSVVPYRYYAAAFSACGTDCGIAEMVLYTSTTSLTVFPSGDITTVGTITAAHFVGDGSGLTGVGGGASLNSTNTWTAQQIVTSTAGVTEDFGSGTGLVTTFAPDIGGGIKGPMIGLINKNAYGFGGVIITTSTSVGDAGASQLSMVSLGISGSYRFQAYDGPTGNIMEAGIAGGGQGAYVSGAGLAGGVPYFKLNGTGDSFIGANNAYKLGVGTMTPSVRLDVNGPILSEPITLASMETLSYTAGAQVTISNSSAPYSVCVSTGGTGGFVLMNTTTHCQ